MEREPISNHSFNSSGFVASLQPLDSDAEGSYAQGSRNQLLLGGSNTRPWKGFQSKGANTGSRVMRQVGSTWGGLKDNGGTQGSGSLFEDYGRSRWFIGSGIPSVAGSDLYVGALASTTLKVAIAASGVYSSANTFSAGLGQPSSPDVDIVSTPGAGLTGFVNGAVSFKLARLRLTTGARSVASTTSAVIVPANKTVRVTFPAASSGQDYWRVFVTQQGFGGVGLHFALPYNGSLDIPEATVNATTVDGVSRSLEFDFKDGDLVPELAYIDDYPPPAGTHAMRLGNVMTVLGCYSDSSTSPTSTSTGTCGAVSLPNFYESYKPRYLVYFPEQVVDALGRPTDDYGYIGHKNSITAMQYVGARDGPAVVVTTISPDVGIQYPHNWCQVYGLLYMMTATGTLVRMKADGSFDYEWGSKVREFIKDWTPQNTILGSHPDNKSVVVMNGGVGLSFSLENEDWSTPCYFADAGVSGSALSCIASQGELVVSVNNGGSHTAYAWDKGATLMPVTSVTNWRRTQRPVSLMELDIAFECDRTGDPLIVAAHRNLRKTFARDFVTTNGSPVISSASFGFDSNHTADMAAVFGANVGGVGVNYLIARLTYVSATQVSMSDPVTGVAVNAQASLASCHVIVGHTVKALSLTRAGQQHTGPWQDFYVNECLSHALSFNLVTSATQGQVFNAEAWGTTQRSSVALTY